MTVFLSAFGAMLLWTVVFRVLFRHLGLVDRPGGRKQHAGDIPLSGGSSILASMICLSLVFDFHYDPVFIVGVLGLYLIGLIDDKTEVAAITKLGAQLIAALLVTLGGGLIVTNFGLFLVAGGPLTVLFGLALSIIAITGLINAFNMIDGIDGLAAGLAITAVISLLAYFAFYHITVVPDFQFTALALLGCLTGFLMFNLGLMPGQKIFLGDNGSTIIGLIISILLISANEGRASLTPFSFSPSVVLWFTAIPVIDTIAVALGRMAERRSPLSPDRRHLHHMIIDRGFSTRWTLFIILTAAVGLASIGIILSATISDGASIGVWALMLGSYTYLRNDAYKKRALAQ